MKGLAGVLRQQTKGMTQHHKFIYAVYLNPLNAELNPICHLLALLGVHHFLHVSRIRVKQELQVI